MRIHMVRNEHPEALKAFDQAIEILMFHLGEFHPLHSTVYSILGYYYVEKGSFQDALTLYKSSLVCCTRVLGPNHPYTGEVYLDLGNLTLKMHLKEEALNYFEKAFYVFEASKGENSIECANTSYQMATLLLSFGRIKEAMSSTINSMRIYEREEEKYVENLLECCILVCQICEIVNDSKTVRITIKILILVLRIF
jgi:tetratricopeptide (TPR) repeat protein